jgi:hypothetical protein
VFSSANALARYTMDELVALGVAWVWLGLEGKQSSYAKLKGTDTLALVRRLQSHGIRVLGSSIIGLPEHGADNIDEAIEHAVAHDTEFHQFMLYTPVPGTPLYGRHREQGTLLDEQECPEADAHGQLRFNYRHPRIPPGQETEMLLRAFRRDFESNGPSVLRMARTLLRGWERHKDHPEPRVRERFRRECRDLATGYAGGVWAARRWLKDQPAVVSRLLRLERGLAREFGWKARLLGPVLGPFILAAMWREERQTRRGAPHEPPTFYEANRPEAFAAARRRPAAARWLWPVGASVPR